MKTIVNSLPQDTILSGQVKKESLVLVYEGDEIIGSCLIMKGYWNLCLLQGKAGQHASSWDLPTMLLTFPPYTFKTTQK